VEVAEAKLNLSYTAVVAQESGLVSKVNVQDGQFIQAGQSIFSIVIPNIISLQANVCLLKLCAKAWCEGVW